MFIRDYKSVKPLRNGCNHRYTTLHSHLNSNGEKHRLSPRGRGLQEKDPALGENMALIPNNEITAKWRVQQMFLPLSLLFRVTLKSISRQGSRPSPPYCAHSPLTLGVAASQRPPRPAGNSSEPLQGQTPGDAPTDTAGHATKNAHDRAHAALRYAAPVSPFPLSSGSSSGLGDRTHQTQPGQPGPAR